MATITKVSPLAPVKFPDLPVIDGVRFATAQAGVKYKGRTDVMLAVAAPILVAVITKISGPLGYEGLLAFPFPLKIEFPSSRIAFKS